MVSGLKRKCPPGNQNNYMNDNHLISCYFKYNRERFSKNNPPLHKILTFYETFWAGQSYGKLGKLSISPVYGCLLPDHYFHQKIRRRIFFDGASDKRHILRIRPLFELKKIKNSVARAYLYLTPTVIMFLYIIKY